MMKTWENGDRVVDTRTGELGFLRWYDFVKNQWVVRFDSFDDRKHSCGNTVKEGHGLWVDPEFLELVDPTVRTKPFDTRTIGEWVEEPVFKAGDRVCDTELKLNGTVVGYNTEPKGVMVSYDPNEKGIEQATVLIPKLLQKIDKTVADNSPTIWEWEDPTKGEDKVNHPKHYTVGRMEVIDIIEDATKELKGIQAVCLGNSLKYMFRFPHKNGIEDLKKAQWYLNKLIEDMESGGNN